MKTPKVLGALFQPFHYVIGVFNLIWAIIIAMIDGQATWFAKCGNCRVSLFQWFPVFATLPGRSMLHFYVGSINVVMLPGGLLDFIYVALGGTLLLCRSQNRVFAQNKVGVLVTVAAFGFLTDRLSSSAEKDEKRRGESLEDGDAQQPADSETATRETTEVAESLHLFWPRCMWLVAMLLVQSLSSLILDSFSGLMQRHMSLAFFLTMLVGLGGASLCQTL
eukprot:Skav217594  [mRNA]  locus=scaffold3512:149898:154078:- [translate_table: standard]